MADLGPGRGSTAGVVGNSARGRWILAATALASGMAFLDGTVVTLALPRLGEDLGADLVALQWVVNAYLLSLASLILLGGSLGDRFGRRRIFCIGVAGFAVMSVVCALAVAPEQLIVARLLQGVFGALLTPGSLAILQATLRPADRATAIGRWSALTSVATVAGPLLGGWLVQTISWRLIFWINVPIAVAVLWIALRHVPETRDEVHGGGRFDIAGAVLAAAALGALTIGLTESATWPPALVTAVLVAAALAAAGFVIRQRLAGRPLMPLELFADRTFAIANAMTLLTYGALGAMTFFLGLQLQLSVGLSPLLAGLATLPMTVLLIALSGRAGTLAQRFGPRPFLAGGPLLCAAGTVLLIGVGPGSGYLLGVLPGVVVFGLGLATLVAPLTATVLAGAPDERAGIASGINNAVSRSGGLLAVAVLPAVVGLSGADYTEPGVFTAGYRLALIGCAVLLAGGGLISLLGLPRRVRLADPPVDPATDPATGPAPVADQTRDSAS